VKRSAIAVSLFVAVAMVAVACGATSGSGTRPLEVGAVYPLSGPDRAAGLDELRGVRLAAELVDEQGGIRGRPVRLDPIDTPTSDAVPSAIATLHRRGVQVVLGSNSSEISADAGQLATRDGMVFWETGAVGEMSGDATGDLAFKVAPSGLVLGSAGIAFIADEMASRLHRTSGDLRFAVVNVTDRYGSAVAEGALREIARRHLHLVGRFRYPPTALPTPSLVSRIAAARPDVLFVASYIPDGVALNRELARQHVPLLANIGTSSSYCMPGFGDRLGSIAVGSFATDKPDGESLNADGLTPGGRSLLRRAMGEFQGRFGHEMSAPALAGFSAAWALFHDVMPRAASRSAPSIAAAALRVHLPMGTLPNGSGLEFTAPGTTHPGSNLRALSVIWEWVGVRHRAVVWPPRYATSSIRTIPLAV
jgi:branched-chain amino acid transport system substrate-binding protein